MTGAPVRQHRYPCYQQSSLVTLRALRSDQQKEAGDSSEAVDWHRVSNPSKVRSVLTFTRAMGSKRECADAGRGLHWELNSKPPLCLPARDGGTEEASFLGRSIRRQPQLYRLTKESANRVQQIRGPCRLGLPACLCTACPFCCRPLHQTLQTTSLTLRSYEYWVMRQGTEETAQ